MSSNHHVEINPSDAGNNDRYVVQEIIKVPRPPLVAEGNALCVCAPALVADPV